MTVILRRFLRILDNPLYVTGICLLLAGTILVIAAFTQRAA